MVHWTPVDLTDRPIDRPATTPLGSITWREAITTGAALLVTVVFAALFARIMRSVAEHILHWYSGTGDPVMGARHLGTVRVVLIVAAALAIGSALARFVERRFHDRIGLHSVAAEASGRGPALSFRASMARTLATWISGAAMVSYGIEAAITETGGAIGSGLARRLGLRPGPLATGGVTAAFSAAYQSPISAVVYAIEHLRVPTGRRTLACAAVGAVGGVTISNQLFHSGSVLPAASGPRVEMLWTALLGLVPAAIGSRLFLEARDRFSGGRGSTWDRPLWARRPVLVVASAVLVGLVPAAAGTGVDAMVSTRADAAVGLALSLAVVKLLATSAAVGSGAPGGVITPSMTVAAGWALVAIAGAEALGIPTGSHWDAAVAAMTVGIAVGMRSPILAAVLVPELTGDLSLIPIAALIAAGAWSLNRGIDRIVVRAGNRLPIDLHDEDG